tara:strand:- start:1282 stop:1527 length:246 start_codon:yes stop_codon:yes gene_type:complete
MQKKSNDPDSVNHPDHYTTGKIEAWDAIHGLGLGYLAGNVVKYLIRYKLKGKPLEDLRKAQAYLNKLIEEETNGFTGSDKE